MRKRLIMAGLLLIATASARAASRNIVLLVGDDHGFQLGCYGDRVIRTPALDRLAEEGTRFTEAFATVSSCSASRSVLMTGQFNHSTGHYGHAHGVHNFHTLDSVRSLPMLLRQSGYRTAVLGKYHLKPPEVYPMEMLPCPGGARNVAAMAESARAYMSDGDKPFFLLVGYVDPHRSADGFGNRPDYQGIEQVTYQPADMKLPEWLPDSPEARAEWAAFCESISRLDQGIGLMLEAIESTGHADDTLVIYLSDNGPPFPGAKTNLYEPGIHLPMIIRSPRQKESGVINHAMVSFVDIAPTILDYAGVKPTGKMVGRSILPILDQSDPDGWNTVFGSHVFHEVTMYYPMRMIRTRRYKYILNIAHQLDYPFASDLWASPTWQGVLKRGDRMYGQRTVDAYIHRPKEELYDLVDDPDELHNLAADPEHADTLNRLRKRLRTWQEETHDPWIVKYTYE